MGDDVSFLLRPVEEEEGENGEGCCAPDVQEFVCQGALVFVMGPSRDFGSREATVSKDRECSSFYLVCTSDL